MSNANVLTVGPGQQYSTVAEAVAAATDGQTIDIQAGTYVDDFATIGKSLVIQAVGGPVVEQQSATGTSPNGKAIWDVGGTGVTDTVRGIEFTGAHVPDDNGAGIRTEGGTLTLDGDYFYANQEGLLAAADPNGILTINDTEFANNGVGDGFTHNLYVNQIATLTINHSYFHNAIVGHEIKSRALNTIVENSRVQDQNGTASYVVDLPNGGNALIENDVLQQGSNAENPVMITYGEEGNLSPGSLTVTGNAIINDLTSHTPVGVRNDTTSVATVTDNLIYGPTPSELTSGPADVSGNTFLTTEPTLDTTTLFPPACFLSGTRMTTACGERPVEALRIGDYLVTVSGAARPIRWIGRRSYAGRFVADNSRVLPVLIRQGALADGVPRRDLFVSPNHAMYLDGVLIPAIELVNGASIVQLETIAQIDYFHLELETHDVILAEGAPTESFVDDDSRGIFQNAGEYRVLYPDEVRAPASYCAPRVEYGEPLEAVRRRLAARAAGDPASAHTSSGPLEGYLDEVGRERIRGWAREPAVPEQPVRLRVLDNGVTVGEVVADRYRADLAQAGIGAGRHAFELIVPGGLSPLARHVIQVQRLEDGRELQRSPRIIESGADAPGALAVTMPPAPNRAWRGHLDEVTREAIRGWAWRPETDAPVALQIIDNGLPVARVLANLYREDLERAGIGRGRHGFDVVIPGGMSPLARHVIEVRREHDGAMLPGSPAVIEAATSFDAALEAAVANAVAALEADGEQERVVSFLIAQTDRLLQRRADAEAKLAERSAYRQFRRRWGPEAERRAGPADPGRRALVIDTCFPAEDRDAGSQAVLSHMRALGHLGYSVSFIAADEMTRPSAMLERAGITCCAAPFYASVEDVLRRQTECFDVVYLHRATIAQRYLALSRRYMPRARILYSVADLHWLRLERQAAVETRPELLAESRCLRFIECSAAWSADAVITHSDYEAMLLREAVPLARVHRVPWQVPVRPARTPFAQRRGLAFVGHYGHAPNQDAAQWLIEAIMPRVWQTDPTIECLLVGSDMPESVRMLAGPRVTPLGHVGELAEVYARVRLTLAPLRYGAGVKGKVLESLAAGTPCVMSPIAAEGLSLPTRLEALVGEDPARLAALICCLHQSEAAHLTAVRSGLAFVRRHHSAAAVNACLRAGIEDEAPRARQVVAASALCAAV